MDEYIIVETAYKNGYESGIRDFVEKLKAHKIQPEFPWDDFVVCETTIDDLMNEMLNI